MFVFQLTLFPYLTFLYTLFLSCEPLVLIHCVISYLHYCSFPYAIVLCRLLLVCYCSAFCYCSSQNNIFHFSVTLLISVFSFCVLCSHYNYVFSFISSRSMPYQTRMISSVPTFVPTLSPMGMVVVVTNMISRWKRMAMISILTLCALCQLFYVNIV